MQRIMSLVLVLFGLCTLSYGQAPEALSYQGLATDALGNPLGHQTVSIRINLLAGSASGTSTYAETHVVTTSGTGYFMLIIGQGSVLSGDFSSIDWSGNSWYLKSEIDTAGGSNYVHMGTTQLLSVPYALHSAHTEGLSFEYFSVFAGENAGIYNSGTHNVFIGLNAGRRNTGMNNTFVGMGSGSENTSGIQNTFLGSATGVFNTTGNSNVFVGFYAGRLNTTGGGNVFVGPRAGTSNTTAAHNTFIGNNAGAAVTTGSFNTLLGALAGRELTDQTYNTMLGFHAGRNVIAGGTNTFLGAFAGEDANGQANTLLGFRAGEQMSGNHNVAVGQWAGYNNPAGVNNVLVGLNAGAHNGGSVNTMLGYAAGLNADGGGNVYVGHRAGEDVTGSNLLIIANERDSSRQLITGDFVTGDVAIRHDLAVGNGLRFPDGSLQTTAALSGDTAVWAIEGTDISYTQGNVQIGRIGDSAVLSVEGAVEVQELRFADGSVQTTALATTTAGVPSGVIVMWSGNTPPAGWALCDGVNGTPDLRGRFVVGFDPAVDDYDQPGNLSGGGASQGETGGADSVVLTLVQMPSHNHGNRVTSGYMNSTSAANTYPAGNTYAASSFRGMRNTGYNHTNTNEITYSGGGQGHENRPPFYVLAYIVKL